MQSFTESGARSGYDGAKRKKGSKVHVVGDTLGHLLALHVTPANERDHAQIEELARQCRKLPDATCNYAGYTGDRAAEVAGGEGIRLEAVKLPDAKRGFILLPRRWVVERSFAWAARFRRLARDDER